jgi:hypothetical protein
MKQEDIKVGDLYLTRIKGSKEMARVVVVRITISAPGTDPTNTYWFKVKREGHPDWMTLTSARSVKELKPIHPHS